jgi:hypothetical protein
LTDFLPKQKGIDVARRSGLAIPCSPRRHTETVPAGKNWWVALMLVHNREIRFAVVIQIEIEFGIGPNSLVDRCVDNLGLSSRTHGQHADSTGTSSKGVHIKALPYRTRKISDFTRSLFHGASLRARRLSSGRVHRSMCRKMQSMTTSLRESQCGLLQHLGERSAFLLCRADKSVCPTRVLRKVRPKKSNRHSRPYLMQ